MVFDKPLVGKLEEILVIEVEEKGEIKTLIIPKGFIIDIKIDSGWHHQVSEEAFNELKDYIEKNKLELKGIHHV